MRSIRTVFKIALAVVVGILLFSVDLMLGTDFGATTSFVMFLVILFVVGTVSGGVRNGLASAMLTLLVMIPIGLLLRPLIPYLPGSGEFATIALLLMIAMMCSPNWGDVEGEPIAVCCVLMLIVTLIVAFAPVFYFAGFLIGGLGGLLGRALWHSAKEPEPKTLPPSVDSAVAPSGTSSP